MAKHYSKADALRDGKKKYQTPGGRWRWVPETSGRSGPTKQPQWHQRAQARAARPPIPKGFRVPKPRKPTKQESGDARSYIKEVLSEAARVLRSQGYDARVRSVVTPAGTVDADIRVTNVAAEPVAAVDDIEDAILLQQKVGTASLWMSVGTTLDVERTNRLRMMTEDLTRADLEAEKRLYPVTTAGVFTVWTHAQRTRDQGEQFQVARQQIIQKGLPGEGAGVVRDISVRAHWNAGSDQPEKRKPY